MSTATVTTTVNLPTISTEAARALVAEARAAAAELGIHVTIAVTDAGGHLKVFDRADDAPFLTVDVAIDKAWTAASFGLATHVWNAILEDSKVAPLAHRPRLVPVGGGSPIVKDGKLIGGIGISGGNALQDQQAAEHALRKLGFDVAE
jgi:uncharacterized protein GlcG (DUF336 family)